jgi:polysaccharide pyruvyl transferase WcaK-like protein
VLAGLLNRLGSRERACVVSRDPALTEEVHGVAAVSTGGALAALARSDAVVIGGGGLFSSHMGTAGRSIAYFGLAALGLGRRVVIHGVSVDPSTPRLVRPGLTMLARRATSVTVRDHASAALLGRWGVDRVTVCDDLSAFAGEAPPAAAEAALRAAGLDLDRPIVGLCLNAVEPRFDRFLKDDVPALIDALPGVQFCFVPMSRHASRRRHNDATLARWLRQRSPGLAILNVTGDPAVLMAAFRWFACTVCMRFHSFLFATRAGSAVVGVPYAPKCLAWMEERGVPPVVPGDGSLLRLVKGALASRGVPPCAR